MYNNIESEHLWYIYIFIQGFKICDSNKKILGNLTYLLKSSMEHI